MNSVSQLHLQHLLERLKLTRILECLDQVAEEAAREHWSYIEFLDRVLDAEMRARLERDVAMKTRLARFPFIKTLEQFDFAFQPSITESFVIGSSAACFHETILTQAALLSS